MYKKWILLAGGLCACHTTTSDEILERAQRACESLHDCEGACRSFDVMHFEDGVTCTRSLLETAQPILAADDIGLRVHLDCMERIWWMNPPETMCQVARENDLEQGCDACAAVTGDRGVGEPCTDWSFVSSAAYIRGSDCAPGLQCIHETCADPCALEAGDLCEDSCYDDALPCVYDGALHPYHNVCITPQPEGHPCVALDGCQEGLYCDYQSTETCKPILPEGHPCISDHECGPTMHCDDEDSYTCIPDGAVGEACGGYGECLEGAWCDYEYSICRPFSKAGDPCLRRGIFGEPPFCPEPDYTFTLICDTDTLTCVNRLQVCE